ncbi:MAG: rRNA pseudouridine synthase [Burkholderiales bacterium]|nr:rRNA pseudouridine synthase [Burkholderiales bacterium]
MRRVGPLPAAQTAPRPADATAEGVRVSKLMTERGLASRREADEWIEAGWVRVDGRPAVLGQRAQPDARIEVDPRARAEQARRLTVLLNKPVGYVSGQPEDGHQSAVVLVRAENRWADDRSHAALRPGAGLRGLAPAGRLDIDSTGLLVLTQDGRIARQLIGEDSAVEKEYLVRVRALHAGGLTADGLARLRHGLALDGVALKPARVSWANEDQLRFVLREGRKRQIRRMCELVGLEVLALKRVRIGSVALGKLPLGCWRLLGPHERFA